jgi:hypothetical protein
MYLRSGLISITLRPFWCLIASFKSWGQCYDFLNIFEKKMVNFDTNYVNFSRKSSFFRWKITFSTVSPKVRFFPSLEEWLMLWCCDVVMLCCCDVVMLCQGCNCCTGKKTFALCLYETVWPEMFSKNPPKMMPKSPK